jgi:hypothetical protein
VSSLGAWVVHDLRRTFGTSLAEMEVEPHIGHDNISEVCDRHDCLLRFCSNLVRVEGSSHGALYHAEMREVPDSIEEALFGTMMTRLQIPKPWVESVNRDIP